MSAPISKVRRDARSYRFGRALLAPYLAKVRVVNIRYQGGLTEAGRARRPSLTLSLKDTRGNGTQ